ncbi:uncharacterized protein TRUGW13939_00614 [Talaromyces rugulosus]|uniref:Myb-like domain-containing protein n=1 Tax=Talaromyces rugulosus TaxID=121627 RepID=A0A7H8QJ96_TALRU|nr:uncharacterized protein TRUGW13939_00614 [Talaromyces rugulosus]QKX53535.1 hypothetical protein TRUGW13939_00614 [Talaromyces rugulosus]
MSSPLTPKRIKTSASANNPARSLAQQQAHNNEQPATSPVAVPTPASAPPVSMSPQTTQPQQSVNPRKRRSSPSRSSFSVMPVAPTADTGVAPQDPIEASPKKKGRTNTPWTAEEEQRLKVMRDAGKSWSEIAKTFPVRTEGSVKKHWYKDMHYAEFGEDESIALREAIKEYESNKWKVIGQKVGKPAKACEQYAKEHFKNL